MQSSSNFTLKQWTLFFLTLIPFGYFSYLNRGLQLDDALIYQRYIRNLFEGHGLVYNPGEFFNGLTSALYTFLTIIASFLIGDIQYATIILATGLMALTLWLMVAIFSRYENFYFVLFGAIFLVCFPYFYLTYGMETPLFLFLITLCIYLFEKQNTFWLGITSALLIITRGEGVFLIFALAIEHFRQKRPFPKIPDFILPLLILVATYLFNKFYYGAFFPDTAAAKIYQGQSGLWGEWPAFKYIEYQVGWFFSHNTTVLYSLAILSILGIFRLRLQPINLIILSFLTFYTLFFVILNIPNYHWYYAPYYLFGFFYTGIGVAWLVRNLFAAPDVLFRSLFLTGIAIFLAALLYTTFMITKNKPDIGSQATPYVTIGQWLKENTPTEAKIALIEIGTVGWYSQRYIIDILGLVNPYNAKFIGERKFNAWLYYYVPDYILIHQPLTGHEMGVKDAILMGDFRLETQLQVPQFQLLVRNQPSDSSKNNQPVRFLPSVTKLSHTTQLSYEQNQAVLMVHAPGELHFQLPEGQYQLTGQFGILADAYRAESESPTDGVIFSALIKSYKEAQQETAKILFERQLEPWQQPEDRGIQSFTVSSFTLKQPAQLILSTDPGVANNAYSDWSFWKAVQIIPF
jgi:hypothetical protein